MKISLILAHPDKKSFNHAIAMTALDILEANRHEVYYHDLYDEKFDPLLPANEPPRDAPLPEKIRMHCDEISLAEGIIVVHPNWWGQPPAILKGWIDRILRPGVAYEFLECDAGEGIPVGLLAAKKAVVFNTSNTPFDRERTVFGDPLETIWKQCIFNLCGVSEVYRKMFGVVVTSTAEERKQWLNEAREIVSKYFPPAIRRF